METCRGTIDWHCRKPAGHGGDCEPGTLRAGVGPVPTGVELADLERLYRDEGGEG